MYFTAITETTGSALYVNTCKHTHICPGGPHAHMDQIPLHFDQYSSSDILASHRITILSAISRALILLGVLEDFPNPLSTG